jgi:hypothetical protein
MDPVEDAQTDLVDDAESAELFVSTLSAIPTQSALRQVLELI